MLHHLCEMACGPLSLFTIFLLTNHVLDWTLWLLFNTTTWKVAFSGFGLTSIIYNIIYYKIGLPSMLSCHSLVFRSIVSWNTICVKWIDKLWFWFTLCAKICTCAFRRKANGSFSLFWGISVLLWVAEELIKSIETRKMMLLDY